MKKLRWIGLLAVLLLIPAPFARPEGQLVDLSAVDGTLSNGTVTITTAATAIPTTALSGRRSIVVINTSTTTVYLGGSTVTTANGYQLKQDAQLALDIGANITLYGIVGSSSSDIRYIEIR